MANKLIYLSNDSEVKKTGLEVYRDISLVADLNQANIRRSYREVTPIAYLSGTYSRSIVLSTGTDGQQVSVWMEGDPGKDAYIQGQVSAVEYVVQGYNIKMQLSDTYYVEEFGDYNDYLSMLGYEDYIGQILDPGKKYITEDRVNQLLLFQNAASLSNYIDWKESKQWNPYKLAKLVNVKAVFNSLRNIFTWTPGERILNPGFGSNLRKLLYEGITDFTSEAITSEIRRCISEYEPRVNVTNIENVSTISDTEQNTIQIDIHFTIPSLSKEQFVYSYTYNQYDNE